ncbi:MAG: hypothetical protein LUE21_12205 [Oscillospiraceae bacterium]|nr:hypothetical protein [Oscillospiraceae bacterium]
MKKLLALILTVCMALSLCTAAFASGEASGEASAESETAYYTTEDMEPSSYAYQVSDTGRQSKDAGHVYIGYDIEDGELVAAESAWSEEDAVSFTSDEEYDAIIDLDVDVEGAGFTSVRSTGDSTVYITGDYYIHDDTDGYYASDFTGTGVSFISNLGSHMVIEDVDFTSEGFVRAFAMCYGTKMSMNESADAVSTILDIRNSTVTTYGKYAFDAWEGYTSSADTSIMITPPYVLGIYGGIRTINVLGTRSTLIIEGSSLASGGWGVLSSDGCDTPYFWIIDTTLSAIPESEGGMNSGWAIFGYDEDAYGSAYGSYLIGDAQEYFYGVNFEGLTYCSILTGGDAFIDSIHAGDEIDLLDAATDEVIRTYTAEEDVISHVNTVFGWMAHNEGTITVGDVIVTPAECVFLYKSADVAFTLDGTTAQPGNGILLQMMDNDDNGFSTYQTEAAGVQTEAASMNVSYAFTTDTAVQEGKTYYQRVDEDTYVEVENPTDEGTVDYYEKTYSGNDVTLDLLNNDYEGDIWNATGYYSENGDVLTVTLTDATLTGRICLSTAPHAISLEGRDVEEVIAAIDAANADNATIVYGDADGLDPIEYEFLDADGNVCEQEDAAYIHFTKWSVNQYYLLGHVENFVNVNGAANINVIVSQGSTWTVTEESVISYLKAEGDVYGTLTENADGTITLMPGDELIPAGEYGVQAVVGSASSSSASGEASGEASSEASGEAS